MTSVVSIDAETGHELLTPVSGAGDGGSGGVKAHPKTFDLSKVPTKSQKNSGTEVSAFFNKY